MKLTRRGTAIHRASAVCAVVLAIGSAGCGDEDEAASESPSAEDSPAPEERCVELWNSSESYAKSRAASQAERGDVVVRVTFAKDFPDKCLIIVAAADIGPGIASIYREVGGTEGASQPYRQVGGGTVEQLADADKEWNARADADGNITTGYP